MVCVSRGKEENIDLGREGWRKGDIFLPCCLIGAILCDMKCIIPMPILSHHLECHILIAVLEIFELRD